MSNSEEIRWKQRLQHFETALSKLTDACERESYSELEMAGLIQFFVFSLELAWNTLQDLLYVEGIETKTPRAVWREANAAGFVEDVDTALSTIAFRNELSHRYDEEMARRAVERIKVEFQPLLAHILARLQEKREREV
ncbi:MAG: HI0074 family nucleotidyltransferase substrate-binding subunit [Gammaproteobacteria bacterium]